MTERNDPLDLPPDVARLTDADLASRGTRKPASDEVDAERSAAARETEPGDATRATQRSAE